MKKFLLIACFISQNIFAMSCPNNGKIISPGYSVDQIIQTCGQPVSTRDYQKTVNTNEVLTYYKDILGANVKITLTFSYGKLANINIIDPRNTMNQTCQTTNQAGETINTPCAPVEQNLLSSGFCGQMIQTGNNINYVRSVCGMPAAQNVTSSITTSVKEMTYNGVSPNILVFENSQLVDWKF